MSRILIADDDPQVGKLFVKALERAGYVVEVVTSGSAVLRRITEASFDLIVLDLSMPEPDGFEVLRSLKAADEKHPPVVVVSGSMGEGLLQASEFLGAAASMPKTAGPHALAEIIGGILGRKISS